MRHCVSLFLGAEFSELSQEVKKYTLKYGETEASSYFTSLLCVFDEASCGLTLSSVQKSAFPADKFASDMESDFRVELSQAESIKAEEHDEKVRSFFTQLYGERVTINNQGDDDRLLLTIFIPLYNSKVWEETHRMMGLIDELQAKYQVDVFGLAPDIAPIFADEEQKEQLKLDYTANLHAMQQVVAEVLKVKKQAGSSQSASCFSHFILMQNCNSKGLSLNLDFDSFVRIAGEYSLLSLEKYAEMYPRVETPDYPISALGLSVLNFDKYYFVHYLLRKAYLNVMDKERVTERDVDIVKASNRAQQCFKNYSQNGKIALLSSFYKKEVEPLLTAGGKSDTEIIEAVTPALNDLLGEIEKDLQSYIDDEKLSLPEKEAILAQVLGEDDELLVGNLIDKNVFTVDSFDEEPANFFIDYNNQLIKREKDEKGKDVFTPGVLSAPEYNEGANKVRDGYQNRDIFLPMAEMNQLRANILEATDYIRQKEEEQKQLEQRIANVEESEKVLTNEGVVVKGHPLQHDVKETPLEEDYYPHVLEKEDSSIDLRPYFTSIKDQGQLGACTIFAITSIFEYILKKSTQQEEDLSERFVYYNVRKEQGDVNTDKGSSIADVVKSYGEYGVCKEELFKYDDKDLVVAPTEDAVADAETRKIVKAKNVKASDNISQSVAIKSAIADGYPVVGSFVVYDSFNRTGADGFVSRPSSDEVTACTEKQNHAMVICGYSDEQKVFIVRNSWSKDWGDKGYCYIPYSYVDDSSLFNMAAIVTDISCSDITVASIPKKMTVAFDDMNANIKLAILRNLVDEEKNRKDKLCKRYAIWRRSYEELLETLSKNSTRDKIVSNSVDRLNGEIAALATEYSTLDRERLTKLDEFKAATRKGIIKGGVVSFVLLLITVLFLYLYFGKNIDVIDAVYVFGGASALSILLLCIWIPYRKRKLSDYDAELTDGMAQVKERQQQKEMELSRLKLKSHLGGMIIDRLHTMQNNLHNKYACMKSFVSNLCEWKKEEQESIGNMDALTKDPFVPLLCNKDLDVYFESKKDELTQNIKLYPYFDGYTLDESGILKFKNKLKEDLVKELFGLITDFDVYDYISKTKSYPYLGTTLQSIGVILSNLDSKSDVFLQNDTQSDSSAPVPTRYLFLKIETQSDQNSWNNKYGTYFTVKPASDNTLVSPYKLILTQIKPLKEEHVKVLQMK